MNIEDLISQYIDGDLPSEVEAEMHHRLAVSPEARKLFRAQIALRGIARNPKVLHAPTPELRARLFDRLEREEGMKPHAPLPSAPTAHAAEMARPVPSPTVSGDTRRRRRGIAWLLPTVMASIITVAILWKPGQPLVRPDDPVVADGSVRSGGTPPEATTGEGTTISPTPEAVPETATGVASGAVVDDAPPAARTGSARTMQARIASKDVAPPPPPTATAPSSRHIATESARTMSPRKSSDGDRMAFAPKDDAGVDAFGVDTVSSSHDVRQDPHTLAADMGGIGASAESDNGAMGRGHMMSKAMKSSPSELGKKFPPPDVHTMEGGAKSERRDGGNGGGPVTEQRDGADAHSRQMTAPPPSGAASESLASSAPSTQSDTVGVRPEGHPQTTPSAFSSSRPDGEGDAVEAMRPVPRFVITVQQSSFVNTTAGSVDLDMGVRGGMQFDRGRQLVFAVIGISGYHSSLSDSVTRLVASGVVSYPSASPQTLRERSYEVAGGLGYRYTVRLSKSWGMGAGAWSTVSAHYVRAGLEAPVTYLPARWLRLEIVPSLRYSGTHGGSALTGESRVLPSGEEETIQRITTPEGDGAVDIGIGFGASVMW